MTDLTVRELGRATYEPVWHAMQHFTDNRDAATVDEFWCVEHDPVFTQGQNGRPEHILGATSIPIVQVDRGGQVTYHGPGQIVLYPLIDIKRRKLGVRCLVSALEQAIIDTLADYDLTAHAKREAPGVYIEAAKIASVGLRIRRGCSFHGLAFNINMDLSPFSQINPCGFQGLAITQLAAFVENVSFESAKTRLVSHLSRILGYTARFTNTQWVAE